MSGLKLFHTTDGGVTEIVPRLAEAEADVQDLIERHMQTMLGMRFLASEYSHTAPDPCTEDASTRSAWMRAMHP